MREEFLHFLWKFKLIHPQGLKTTDGESVIVHTAGLHNQHAGPDFLNARLSIGDKQWAGHVEIHIKTSDWMAHNHQHDAAYNNVVLHVVHEDVGKAELENGQVMPTLVLKGFYDESYLQSYSALMEKQHAIPCHQRFGEVSDLVKNAWLDRLAVERLQNKTYTLKASYDQSKGDWNATFFIVLARNFGFKVNADAMELLARSIPFSILNKHRESVFQLEALLFGQSGMLEDADDSYGSELYSEYLFLQRKYGLQPINKSVWKYFRLMPVNFPTVRMAQLAQLIHKHGPMFSKILESADPKVLRALFEVEPSGYWQDHYSFGKQSTPKPKKIGKSSIEIVLINTVAPMLFLYGMEKGKDSFKERAGELWEACKAENNAIMRIWKGLGADIEHAAHSQAYLQLKASYCDHKKCVTCPIGVSLLKQNVR